MEEAQHHNAIRREESGERAAIAQCAGQWFFAQHVEAGLERGADHGQMQMGRGADRDGSQARGRQQLVERGAGGQVMFGAECRGALGVGVADADDVCADSAVCLGVVSAHLSESDDADARPGAGCHARLHLLRWASLSGF